MAVPRASARLSGPSAALKAAGIARSPLVLARGRRHRHGRRAGACARRPAGLERALPATGQAARALSFGFRCAGWHVLFTPQLESTL